ncbi:MAG: DNA ligase [Xanthobacteraceae bacterium]
MSRPVHPSGFVSPCLPSRAERPPSGPDWVHEIKHDGFRLLACREGNGVRLFTRRGIDWTDRFPLILAAVSTLTVRSCLIDGEAVACDQTGLTDFQRLRYRRAPVHLVAFDVLELDGRDIRREPFSARRRVLAKLLRRQWAGLVLNETYKAPGEMVYDHACALGCEGIVSKHVRSAYLSGRTDVWRKVKNPDAPAIRREFEEDWRRP